MHALQERLLEARKQQVIDDVVLLVEHEPVITLGRGADEGHVLMAEKALAQRGVDLVRTGRGGDVTYHGPGQLVGYPIVDLRPNRCDVRRYVRSLAEVMILMARDYGVEAGVVDGMVGVWADAGEPQQWAGEAWAATIVKLGAIGVRISRWVTMHGFALNVTTALEAFQLIVPCGLRDHGVASIRSLTGDAPDVAALALTAAEPLRHGLGIAIDGIEDLSAADNLDAALIACR